VKFPRTSVSLEVSKYFPDCPRKRTSDLRVNEYTPLVDRRRLQDFYGIARIPELRIRALLAYWAISASARARRSIARALEPAQKIIYSVQRHRAHRPLDYETSVVTACRDAEFQRQCDGRSALMRINIWLILGALLALLAITRYTQQLRQDTQHICATDPTASVCHP
jgi:hypothetical protein